MAVDLAEQHRDPIGTVVVPVGGGGLIAGIAVWLKDRHPEIRIVGAEPAGRGVDDGRAGRRRPDRPARRRHVRRRRRGRPGRPPDLPDRPGPRRRDGHRPGGRGFHRDARPLPVGGDHRRAGRRAGQRGRPPLPGRRAGRLHRLGREQRRQPVRGGRRAVTAPRGSPALLPDHLPPRARRAAPVPRHRADAPRGHRRLRVHQEEQPGDRPGARRHRPGDAADYDDLVRRMDESPLQIERVPPGSPLFSFLL